MMRGKIKTIASLPLRIWRSRGFGVHSPFAFRFITGVLRSSDGYYAYSAIGSSASARRLYRIILALAPGAVVVTGPLGNADSIAVSLARTETAESPDIPKLAIVPPEAVVGISYLRSVLNTGGAVVFTDIRDTRSAEIFSEISSGGMTFAGIRQAVIVGGNLPRQTFPLMM